MKLALGVGLLALALAGCGVNNTDPLGMAPPPGGVPGSPRIYLIRNGALAPVDRPARFSPGQYQRVEELFRPLTAREIADGYSTELPTTTSPISVTLGSSGEPVQVEVDTGGRLRAPLSTRARQQLACTVPRAQLEVQLILDGQRQDPVTCPVAL